MGVHARCAVYRGSGNTCNHPFVAISRGGQVRQGWRGSKNSEREKERERDGGKEGAYQVHNATLHGAWCTIKDSRR